MRLKRLMSVVLAVVLVMSLAMSASAGSLYLSYDFDNSVGYKTWRTAQGSNSLTDAEGNTIVGNNSGNYNVLVADKIRTAGTTRIFVAGSYLNYGIEENNTNTVFVQNPNGNWVIDCGSTSTQHQIAFVTDQTWDGSVNTNETYVISYDMAYESEASGSTKVVSSNGTNYTITSHYPKASNDYGIFHASGLATDGTSYKFVPIMANKGGYGATMYGTGGTGGVTFASVFGAFEYGHAYRIATGFKYDASKSELLRTTAADGKVWETNWADSNALKNIDAAVFRIGGYSPLFGKIRMYTINDAEGFKVTAPIDGEDRASVDTSVVTLTFTHPVSEVSFEDAEITFTANGADASDDIIVGDVVTGTVGGSYVSTVDVTLPALALSTDYEITITGVTNELGTALADNTISFSTPKPDITTSATITGAAVGSMSEASVAVSNNTVSTPKAVSVIYAVYTSAGKLVDVVYANDTVAAGTTATISAGIKLGTDAAKAKVMVWDGANLVNPFTGFTSATVAQ